MLGGQRHLVFILLLCCIVESLAADIPLTLLHSAVETVSHKHVLPQPTSINGSIHKSHTRKVLFTIILVEVLLRTVMFSQDRNLCGDVGRS